MAKSNRDRVGAALDLFVAGMVPFIEREMQARHQDKAEGKTLEILRNDRSTAPMVESGAIHWDTTVVIKLINAEWRYLFRNKLGKAERAMLNELLEVRNNWAHQQSFGTDDTLRAIDTIDRLLTSVAAAEQAAEVEKIQGEVMRTRFQEMARREREKAKQLALEGQPMAGLKPWRDVIMPHSDVATGRYAQAEFAADLAQVVRGGASGEYADPMEFYRRTYITDGLRRLLLAAIKRLTASGGDPVIELQTNFGGGKTHSMLALFHLVSGVTTADLAGVDVLLKEAGVEGVPEARRAVIVGTAISAGQPQKKPDGTVVNTLWGDLAWQLLGKEGYAIVGDSDTSGVNPGSNVLSELLQKAAPCLILIDEWVAFCRQLYEVTGLPGGSFDANMSFAHSLTEAVKAAPQAMLVASLPQSDIEIGGEGGRQALARLEHTFERIEASWRPASAAESYEIVRRRLFEPIIDPQLYAARDAVVQAYGNLYRSEAGEFPSECREGEYERQLQASYPIHPELFERLYSDWSSLEQFQRTRGMLRLMASVIYTLWARNDQSLLIMPCMIPIDEPVVQEELTRYLPPTWVVVMERDVDGENSLPMRLDRDNPNLGRYSAARRAARTIYMGSAPIADTARRGIDDHRVKLGCVQPGENVPIFGDALRRLTDQATHLYVDGTRYWFSTQPSVTQMARDRAAQQKDDDVAEEIKRRLKAEEAKDCRGEFERVSACPSSSSEIPDEGEARLIILDYESPHVSGNMDSPAVNKAGDLLENRGSGPRIYRNSLVFLAADRTRLKDLDAAVRQYLAWTSIHHERTELNLDPFQSKQAETKAKQADDTVTARIPEAFQWLLIPCQPDPQKPIQWQAMRLQGRDRLAIRASKKLVHEELLVPKYAGTRLRMDLDRVPLWRGNHVSIKQLSEDFAQYPYLPRFKNAKVLSEAIAEGVSLLTWREDTFAYADSWDEERGRYVGLRGGAQVNISLAADGLLVKPEVAAEQLKADQAEAAKGTGAIGSGTTDSTGSRVGGKINGGTDDDSGGGATSGGGRIEPPPEKPVKHTRFHGCANLDPVRVGLDASNIANEVIAHLSGLVSCDVKVTLEIEAEIPDGAPDHVVRTVTENCRTLKFETFGFEE